MKTPFAQSSICKVTECVASTGWQVELQRPGWRKNIIQPVDPFIKLKHSLDNHG